MQFFQWKKSNSTWSDLSMHSDWFNQQSLMAVITEWYAIGLAKNAQMCAYSISRQL